MTNTSKKTAGGGTVNCMTLKRAQEWIDTCGQAGYSISLKFGNKRNHSEPVADYLRRISNEKYIVTDAERGMRWMGRTPRQALQNAGCLITSM